MGRPKKQISDLPEGWQETIISMYSEGKSDTSIKAYLIREMGSFSNDLWERFMKEEEAFSETIKRGRLLSGDWWEERARKALENPKFNSALWYMNMKNRFGWKDKQELSGDKKNPLAVAITEVRQYDSDKEADTSD